MKTYKIFRVEDGQLMSAIVEGRACIEYCPGRPSMGQVFAYNGGQIRLPIMAYRDIESAERMKKWWAKVYLRTTFETWKVEGKYSRKKIRPGDLDELELGKYRPDELSFPAGTIFLETCTPVKRQN